MVINMTNTWGDPYYIGLSGLDIFDQNGKVVKLKDPKKQVSADPSDINILEGYSGDPRTVDKIFDGVNRTSDDYHVWLAPFTEGKNHTITVTFDESVTISLLRFWNYNKSRIHSFRGARCVEITLDGVLIFAGEIRKAPGNINQADSCAEYILFTLNDQILSAIEENDPLPPLSGAEVVQPPPLPRPATSGVGEAEEAAAQAALDMTPQDRTIVVGDGSRPKTKASKRPSEISAPISAEPLGTMEEAPLVKTLSFNFRSTWGDAYYLGLTELQIFDDQLQRVPLEMKNLWANPKDINDLPEATRKDDRTLDKLIDGVCVTMEDQHMWMIPFTVGQDHLLTITLEQPTRISCIKVWNYNKTPEDTYRGAKRVVIKLDDKQVTPNEGIILRKAPGTSKFDFGQVIQLAALVKPILPLEGALKAFQTHRLSHPKRELIRQGYDMTLLPSGFIFKFVFLSTWGDPYYLGLNGLEIYDLNGLKVPILPHNVTAVPSSINTLPDVKNDPRTLDKLFDGVNDTYNDEHMWLTTYTPGQPVVMHIFFDEPVAISMIKFWNYSKTPQRGIEQFELFIDDLLIYKGFLKEAPEPTARSRGSETDFHQTVLFSNSEELLDQEKQYMLLLGTTEEQHVQFINERQIVIQSSLSQREQLPITEKRPKTSAQGDKSEL